MDFLINAVAKTIGVMAKALPNWEFGHDLAQDISTIKPYLDKANFIMPIDTMLVVSSLYIGLQLVLMAFYWIVRTINLIRGAG